MTNDPDDGGRASTKEEIIAGWVILLLLTALGLLALTKRSLREPTPGHP